MMMMMMMYMYIHVPVSVVPYLDSPVSSTRGKHLLMERIPSQSVHSHVVILGDGGGGERQTRNSSSHVLIHMYMYMYTFVSIGEYSTCKLYLHFHRILRIVTEDFYFHEHKHMIYYFTHMCIHMKHAAVSNSIIIVHVHTQAR